MAEDKQPERSKKDTRRNTGNSFLRLVSSDGDPELYNSDLHWFFNCYDAECGFRSASGADAAGYQANVTTRDRREKEEDVLDVKAKKPIYAKQENLTYTDRHATYQSNHKVDHRQCVFTKGRRIWQALSSIAWSYQQDLRLLYEPRRHRPSIPEWRVRMAHLAYLVAAKAVRV